MAKLVTAASQYAKDLKLHPEDVAQLRHWLSKQPHLPQHITDEFLITVLHSSEYSVEQAKQLLEKNITSRTNFTEMFANKDPLSSQNLKHRKFLDIWTGPKATEEKHHLIFIGLNNFDPELFDFPALLNTAVSVLDSWAAEIGVVPGIVIILNCQGITLTHLTKANISHIRNILYYVQEAICLKIKAVHVINVFSIIDKIMFVVKPFLKKELLDILYFHSGEMEEFYKAIPKDIIPKEIGGTMGSKQELIDNTRDRLEQMRSWLIEQESLRVDQSKRTNTTSDNFSMAGSFRKLELD